MSHKQVAAANRAVLKPASFARQLYKVAPGLEGRYETWETHTQKFLGRDAVISYSFVEDQLFTFHIFTSGDDEEALDADMSRYLNRVFGPRSSNIEDGSSLKRVWHFKDRNVNYWLYEEEIALRQRFKAGFGVVYKPIEQKLKSKAV